METKEAILSTISELNNIDSDNKENINNNISIDIQETNDDTITNIDEISTLLCLKEKSLVLFEGLKNSNNSNLEAKLNMVISYLEYQLYVIEDRLMTLQEMAGVNNDRSNNDRR